MRLWLRIAWRLLEWPASVGPAVAVLVLAIYTDIIRHGETLWTPAALAVCSIFVLPQTVNNTPLSRYLTGQWRKVVTEERKKMETERGSPSNDTYLRPVE